MTPASTAQLYQTYTLRYGEIGYMSRAEPYDRK